MSKSASERKVLRSLNFLCAKTRKSEELSKNVQDECVKIHATAKNVQNECENVMSVAKSVQDECTKISDKIPDTLQKAWWRDADAITRIALCVGLIICTSVLSCSMRVGALKELSDRADSTVKQCEQISNRLDNVTKMISSFNDEVQRLCTTNTNTLLNISSMIDNASNQVERINNDNKRMRVNNGED